ncbi:hypothetical protein [Sphaerisporangium krabiense]|uniref:Uncharacterized protein n=1 Tax=Sphaerisporangium krabiense TaxID=763782 RepID=A0A7W8ZA01_9ACTN|nr:hypothetical protein [Sphaerisporangium krabiense]MBB5630122.1 hypothetical protein [Sphaerisporangium krabiense]
MRLKPHQSGRISRQIPELGRLGVRVAEFLKQESDHLPFVVFQVLQHTGHADAGLGSDVAGAKPSGLQQQGVQAHTPIVTGCRTLNLRIEEARFDEGQRP